jgi:hypothetical protein
MFVVKNSICVVLTRQKIGKRMVYWWHTSKWQEGVVKGKERVAIKTVSA